MAWKLKYRCNTCGYEAEVYEGRGLFRQQITAVSCPDCKTIQNIVVGGIIADVAPSYRSEVGRLCLQCGSDNIRIWDKKTCPRCQGRMEETGEKEFWTLCDKDSNTKKYSDDNKRHLPRRRLLLGD